MPFKSDKQRRLMYAVANDPKLAEEKGISQEVARKFIEDAESGESVHKKMNRTVDEEMKKRGMRK